MDCCSVSEEFPLGREGIVDQCFWEREFVVGRVDGVVSVTRCCVLSCEGQMR